MSTATPFSHWVPRDLAPSLRWRARAWRRVLDDPDYAGVIRDACARDPIFFINGFVYTYDPRRKPFSKLPMILYPFQEVGILEIQNAINDHDLFIEKSRDMGASWLCILSILHQWIFKPGQSFLFVSRTENYVDQSGNPKALFWKVDYALRNLPTWLRPKGYNENEFRRKLHIENPENGSVIDGEATTGQVARGDRRTAIMLDEFAAVEQGHHVLSSTRDATNCRIFNSTPSGTNNAYYDIRQTNIKKLRFHWIEHPLKSIGLYTTDENGGLKVLDAAGYPEGYDPILDGKQRSPWYDNECERAATPQEIAQELDIDYLGSGYQYFNSEAVMEVIRKYARPPMLVGDLEHDAATGEPIRFREDPKGSLRLWCLLNRDNEPPKDHRYVLGNDISAGTGASNSAIAGYDSVTNEKILEYANAHIRPEALAKQAVAIARWLGGAFLVWESNGPGRQFGSRVIELKYFNIFYRKREEAISKKQTDIPGWASTKEGKLVLMGNYRAAVEKGECVNRSKEALEETLEYVFAPDGSVQHSRSLNKTDPSGAKSNHGDRAMADALAWKGLSERQSRLIEEKPGVPIGSLAWRQEMREIEKQENERDGW